MKKLMWAILILVMIAYSIVVWSWIQEGNREFEQSRADHAKDL